MEKYINLNIEDIEKLPIIGKGTDGTVYDAKNGTLYKIYNKKTPKLIIPEEKIIRDEDGVIITKAKDIIKSINYYEQINYRSIDNTKLRSEDSIQKAIEKQSKINNTNLPLSAIYINGRFAGCVLKKAKYTCGIHKAFALLPTKYKLKILIELLNNIKELLNNNIYLFDLHNKPDENPIHHSNILINYKLKPIIIDIDGKSALYREHYNEYNYKETLNSLTKLYLDLLYNIDLVELENTSFEFYQLEINSIEKELEKHDIKSNIIDRLINNETTMQDIEYILKKEIKKRL